ncbi:S1 family peptidase [Nocardia sp. CDC153]|uniref:S1 family peptidase n=1 Tax=Nocardia sp. CDC153 TaxID=3112167 RepID=UPI002DB6E6FD|nr:S1 family peptidase [Nocardia sp. CDC153]MEC3952090.1 S1 family peptidase [Nocardia sp. CDC153]
MANCVGRRVGCAGFALVAVVGVLAAGPGHAVAEPGAGMPPGLVAAIERDLGVDVGEYSRWSESTQRVAGVEVGDDAADSAVPVDGGDRFVTDAGYACSWAFNAVDAEGNSAALTAGHCDAATEDHPPSTAEGRTFEATPAMKTGAQVGVFEKSVMDGVRDYAIVRIADGKRDSFRNNMVRTPDGAIPITGVGIPAVGEPVCKYGSTTGFTCGIILAVDQPDPHRPPIRFTHTALSLPGDSGGALFSGTLAMGIVSRGGYTDDPYQFPTDKPDPVHTAPLPPPLDQIGKRFLAGDGRPAFERLAPLVDAIMRAYPQLTMIAQSVADVLAENPGFQIRFG